MKQSRAAPGPVSERDSVLREVEQVLQLARSVSLGPAFDDIIRNAVERAIDRLMAATRRRTARLTTLSAVQQTVAAGFDLRAIMSGVYAHLREILDAPSFVVASYDAATGLLRCEFVVADGRVVADAPFPPLVLGEGPVSQVVRTGQPRIVHDVLTEPAFGSRRLVAHGDDAQPVRSVLYVPMRRGEDVVGVMQAQSYHTGAYGPEDVEFLATVANQTAMAMENTRLYQEALRHSHEMEALLHRVEQSRNYLQTLMDRTYAAVFVLDPAGGRLRNVNTIGADLLGRDRTDILRLCLFDLAPDDDHAAWETLVRDAPAGGDAIHAELHVLGRDGAAIPLDVTATRLDVDDAPAVVCLARDRRPRIRREEAERLRALGEMASGVAHDFNNLLGVILGRTELMISRTPPSDTATRGDLGVIRQMALDGAETVKRLQAFSGVARLTQRDVADVGRVLSDAVEFTRPRWKDAAQQRGVTIEVAVESGVVPPAAGSAPELREVLINMIFNAVDAMPHGGRIALRAWSAGERVFISVADSGVGMPEAVRTRIFEPFFTTKGTHGSGLGLSASYGIVSRMGGRITVESAPFQGTTFTIDLPVGELVAAAPAEPEQAAGPRTLLLVDDEPQMLRTTKLMLETEGHLVTAVPGGHAALELLDQSPFDAVLTDLGMPEINGLQLTEAIRARGHTLPVLLITGWGLELEAERVREIGVTDILPKPFDGERLRTKLAAVLATT